MDGSVDDATLKRCLDVLREAGHRPGLVLGSGMEGTVVALGDGLVAKIWQRRTRAELEIMRTFYDAVDRADLGLRTPKILELLEIDGRWATVEPLITGTPLWTQDGGSPEVAHAEATCVGDVLAALSSVEATSAMGVLPVLEGEQPFRRGVSFERSLAGLVERRVERFRDALWPRLPALDALAQAVVTALEALDPARPVLVHGDLIPANILVDGALRVTAALDFGFLTTIGDAAFDAAVTASIYDMYGPRAAENEQILDRAFTERFGHEPARLAVYRAAYALVTSNCFSVSGSDGHFDWCLGLLSRPDIRDALGV